MSDLNEHSNYSVGELEALPTLSQGQADDLKIDDGEFRVWLSRVHRNAVSVERLIDGRWLTVAMYYPIV